MYSGRYIIHLKEYQQDSPKKSYKKILKTRIIKQIKGVRRYLFRIKGDKINAHNSLLERLEDVHYFLLTNKKHI